MKTISTALLALAIFGAVAPAFAQRPGPPPPPAVSQKAAPPVFIDRWNRGPPMPPDRPRYLPRSEVAPPMERVPQVAPLSPRVGN